MAYRSDMRSPTPKARTTTGTQKWTSVRTADQKDRGMSGSSEARYRPRAVGGRLGAQR